MGILRFLACAAFLILPLVAAGQEAGSVGPSLAVASLEPQDSGFRVKLRGKLEARDGDVLLLRVLPLMHRLDSNEASLVASPWQTGARTCSAEVSKGAFSAEFKAAYLFEYEVRITRLSGPPDASPLTYRILLFDARAFEGIHKEDLKAFSRHLDSLRGFASEIEPFARSRKRVPVEYRKRLQAIEGLMRFWIDRTDFTAAGAALAGAAAKMFQEIPWDVEVVRPSAEMPYGAPLPPDPAKFEIQALKDRLAFARDVAFREALLKILVPLENFVAVAVGQPDGQSSAKAKGSVRVLRSMLRSLGSGELADLYAQYPGTGELESLAEQIERAILDLSEPWKQTRDAAIGKLKDAGVRLKAAEEAGAQMKGR